MGSANWNAWNDPRNIAAGITNFPLVWDFGRNQETRRILFGGPTGLGWYPSSSVKSTLEVPMILPFHTTATLENISIPTPLPPDTPRNKERKRASLEQRQTLARLTPQAAIVNASASPPIQPPIGPRSSNAGSSITAPAPPYQEFGPGSIDDPTRPPAESASAPPRTQATSPPNQLAALRRIVEEDNAKFIQLNEQLRELQIQNDTLEKQLGSAESIDTFMQLQQVIEHQDATIQEKNSQLEQQTKDYARLETELKQSREENAKHRRTIDDLTSKLEDKSQGYTNLESEVTRLNKAISDFDEALTTEMNAKAAVVQAVENASNRWNVLHEISASFKARSE
ncbi:hypothetical protein DL96DRAFT_1616745 [Flagelloscypha sp. PMI_526]|nr:hypothetical protein DL96DRAFT_1616745 [Flagelloscypha sp. PMI_526]